MLGGSHSGNVAAAELGRLGLVDALSSDYAPSSLLIGTFLLARALAMPLHWAVGTVTSKPASLVGLENRGNVAVGLRADLLRVRVVDDLPLVSRVWREGALVA